MKKEDLIGAIGNIDGKYIVEAEYQGKIKKHSVISFSKYQSWISVAACICILVIAGIAGGRLVRNHGADTMMESAQMPADGAGVGANDTDSIAEETNLEDFGADEGLDLQAVVEGKAEETFDEAKIDEVKQSAMLPEMLLERKVDQVEEVLKTYPNDAEELMLTDAYVISLGAVESGQERWDDFYESVQVGVQAQIVIAQFTDEGDAILDYLNYNGEDFYIVEDDSRDQFAGQGEKYWEKTFSYLKKYDITNEENAELGAAQMMMLVNDDSITYEDLEAYWEKSEQEEIPEKDKLEYLQLFCIQ